MEQAIQVSIRFAGGVEVSFISKQEERSRAAWPKMPSMEVTWSRKPLQVRLSVASRERMCIGDDPTCTEYEDNMTQLWVRHPQHCGLNFEASNGKPRLSNSYCKHFPTSATFDKQTTTSCPWPKGIDGEWTWNWRSFAKTAGSKDRNINLLFHRSVRPRRD